MQLATPSIWNDSVASAYEAACGRLEPIFVPVAVHADDRGWSIMNQLQGVMGPQGQVNYSVAYPGVIKAWHRHHHQSDFWLCLHGHIKVGVQRESDGRAWQLVTGERRPGILIIPPPLWHGMATVGHEPAGLLYYVTRAYNPQAPDEDRRPFDALAEFPWSVVHR